MTVVIPVFRLEEGTIKMSFQRTLKLSGLLISCRLEYIQNIIRYRKFIVYKHRVENELHVTDVERGVFHKVFPDNLWNAEAESKAMMILVSDELISYDRLIIHSVAFAWRGKAWLLSAPSGTGKTTQYNNLKSLFGEEIQIICGDNPILHFQDNGVIMVYPSPWNGKENYGSDLTAPLGGIIYLSQSPEDDIFLMEPKEAVVPIFFQLNTFSRTKDKIRKLLRYEEKLITSVPVWHFENTGTLESTTIMMACLEHYFKKEQNNDL